MIKFSIQSQTLSDAWRKPFCINTETENAMLIYKVRSCSLLSDFYLIQFKKQSVETYFTRHILLR